MIPVAIGNKPVPDFEKEFPDEDVIRTKVTDHPIKTADKIQDKLEDGNELRFKGLTLIFNLVLSLCKCISGDCLIVLRSNSHDLKWIF